MTATLAMLAGLMQHAHGAKQAPSFLEYVIVAIACVVCAYALVRAVQWTIRPGEHSPDHIKRTILEDAPRTEPGSVRRPAAR
jgi:hypothetical protein